MGWNDIANNQTVSFNNLQNAVTLGVFTQKTTIPSSNKCITKADANTYVNINTSYAPYSNKANNQLVVKSDLQSASGGTQAVLQMGAFIDAGDVIATCSVSSGSILDTLTISGTTRRRSLADCLGVNRGDNTFSLSFSSGDTYKQTVLVFDNVAMSLRYIVLSLNGNSLSTSPQTIQVNGRNYQIFGWNECYNLIAT